MTMINWSWSMDHDLIWQSGHISFMILNKYLAKLQRECEGKREWVQDLESLQRKLFEIVALKYFDEFHCTYIFRLSTVTPVYPIVE